MNYENKYLLNSFKVFKIKYNFEFLLYQNYYKTKQNIFQCFKFFI